MKISELIENCEPFDWPVLKVILLAIAEDKDVLFEPEPPKEG